MRQTFLNTLLYFIMTFSDAANVMILSGEGERFDEQLDITVTIYFE